MYLGSYRVADKSLARPTSRCILFDGEKISFDASLVIYINSTNIPPIIIINRTYENQNLLSYLVSVLVWLRNYQHPCLQNVQTVSEACPASIFIGYRGLISLLVSEAHHSPLSSAEVYAFVAGVGKTSAFLPQAFSYWDKTILFRNLMHVYC
jgi:hypothetical protein